MYIRARDASVAEYCNNGIYTARAYYVLDIMRYIIVVTYNPTWWTGRRLDDRRPPSTLLGGGIVSGGLTRKILLSYCAVCMCKGTRAVL